MIYHLKLKDFGPHEDFTCSPKPGPNLFLGPNGCGKSNVVYAIGWAILGPRSLPGAYSQKDIIRDGASSTSVEVTLDFIGRRLTFFRSYDGKNTAARVTEHETGDVLADSSTGVTEFLTEHGFDWDAASVPFCRQRDLDAFVHETPANRQKIIASLLQLESLAEAAKYVRAKAKNLPNLQEEPELEPIKRAADARLLDVREVAGGVGQAKTELHIAEADLATATLSLPTDTSQEERNQLIGEISHAKTQLDFHQRDEQQWLSTENTTFEDKRAATEDAQIAYADATTDYTKARAEYDRQQGLMQHAAGQRDAVLTLVSDLKDVCPICATPLTATTVEALTDFKGGIAEVRQETVIQAEALAVAASKDMGVRAGTAAELEAEVGAWEAQEAGRAQLADARANVKLWYENLETLNKALEELPAPPSQETFNHVRALQGIVDGKRSTVVSWETEERKANELLSASTAELGTAQKLIRDQVDLRASIDTHKRTGKALTTFRDQLLRGALTWVSGRATQVLQASGESAVAPKGSRLELDEKLVYSVVLPDGTSQPVYRVSGGQAAVFSTCLRIALSEYLADRMGMNGLLLLDAIFEPMNDENRAVAAHAIKSYGPPQTLLFSYFDVPELEAYLINVV